MRNTACAVIACFLIAGAFAKGGVMAGAGKLSVIRTQYFDIIYPEESQSAAHKIALVADGYYQEICALLQTPCNKHFPVTITHAVESLNAYFTASPYNAIVLYDTPPDESLDMHTHTLESVFYHELTHAVTTNMRSPAVAFFSALLGDWFAPAGFMQTRFMLEGAAVSFESLHGEGRVYDPYNTQIVQQAKADGRFPSWRDVTGARDTFPGGTDAYAFGALFCHFLQETYGMEAYATFWRTTGSMHGFKRSIKKTYGKPIAELWKEFEAWVRVPALTPVVSADRGTSDFFAVINGKTQQTNAAGFTARNERQSVFTHIDANAYGAVWYDSQTGGIWHAELTADGIAKPKKLFTCAAVTRLALSPDNAWLCVSYLHADANTKTAICLYDMRTGRLVTLPIAPSRDAGFVRAADGSLQLVCVHTANDSPSLDFYAFGARKKDVVLVKQVPFAADELVFSPVAAKNGGFACIVKHGMDWHIRLYDDDMTYRAYGGEKTMIHHLHALPSAADGRLTFSFSYARFGSTAFSRAGLLYVSQADAASELVLQNDDVAGSVLDAALLPADRGEHVLYVAACYDTQRLMRMDFSKRKVIRHKGSAPPQVAFAPAADTEPAFTDTNAASGSVPRHLQTLSYNPFRYYRRGMYLPLGMVTSYKRDALDEFQRGYTSLGTAFVGATYGSSNPWNDKIAVLSGGWNPFDKNGGVYADYFGGTDTFTYDVNANVLFDGYGFMQTTEGLSLAKTLYVRYGKRLSAGANGVYFYGHDTHGADDDWAMRAQGYVQFSTVRKMSPRYADYGGVWVQPFVLGERVTTRYVNAGATVGARIPGLFPLSLSATLFPSSSYAASATARVMLCSWEVQRGIPLALYINRFYLSAAYTGRISYACDEYFDMRRTADIFRHVSKDAYSDTVQVTLGTVAAINAGLLTRLGFDVGVVWQYRPHPKPNDDKMSVGVSASLVY